MSKRISKKDKIFIAGASGMAGSAIKRAMLRMGYGDTLKGGKLLTPNRKELDLLNYEKVDKWFKNNRPDIVILAAAKVGGILANKNYPADFLLENIQIQTNVIKLSWEWNVKRLLFLGSSCIYPKYAKQPIKEEYLLDGELEKTNETYAIAKICGLKLCESLRNQYGFDSIALMPTNLYGPGDNYDLENSHVIAGLIRKFLEAKKNNLPFVTCWGSGNPKREFMHADDLGGAVIHVLEKWDPDHISAPKDEFGKNLYFLNVGTGKEISIKNLSEKISNTVGYKGLIYWDKSKPDGTPMKRLNINKIKEIGWVPTIDLEDGLIKTIKSIDYNKDFN
tara:strand:- start:34154 stop:35158 length:1005 start_codon:yes stop_codon:yes gene_type:complete